MNNPLDRRSFLASTLAPLALCVSCRTGTRARQGDTGRAPRLLFVSQGKIGQIQADGAGLRYLEFDVPGQATWQTSDFFPDGNRVLLLSMEPRRDGPGRPFDQYYTQTPTHLWIYHLDTRSLKEIATHDRMAPFYTPQLLLGEERMLVQVVRNRVGQTFNMNLDGSDAREFTRAGEGLPYGFSPSPDGRRVAWHLASPDGYQIWTSDTMGGNRIKIAGQSGHLYFGPVWSPDGNWLAYQDCRPDADPGHDWSDVCISRPDGTESRMLTHGGLMWFGATYGKPGNRGGGSNVVAWTRDNAILFPCRLPGSKVAWEYQPQRPDEDHFNREYKPELARGGTQICRLEPQDNSIRPLTFAEPSVWTFRSTEYSDGRWIAYCRAATGEAPEIWTMAGNGGGQRLITQGLANRGADHPRWLPSRILRGEKSESRPGLTARIERQESPPTAG